MDLFECINNLFTKKVENVPDDVLSGKLWMTNRFLGLEPDLTEYIAYVSKYFYTLGNRYYKLLYRLLPKAPAQRIPYVKPKKDWEDDLLERYAKLFQLGKAQTADYLRILSVKKSMAEIYSFVGLDVKEIKKTKGAK